MNETRREYLKRIHTVLDFIEANLDGDLSLNRLSDIAHYSNYHFHRVFLTVVGERVNEFVSRKRIERIASILLVNKKIPLKDLAYTYGFNSETSFSRTFKKFYGVSPTTFKSEGKTILSKIGIVPFTTKKYICSIDNNKQWIDMKAQIQIKELSEIQLACISHIGDFREMGNMIQRLMKWGHQKAVLDMANFKTVTIYHDNPNVTQDSKLRFSAGVTIKEDIQADGDIRQLTLEKGTYAVGHFEIKPEEISKAWKSMHIWVIENDYEFRDGEYSEMYHNDHRKHPEQKCILDICIPLVENRESKHNKPKQIVSSKSNEISNQSNTQLDYHQLIGYMKELRTYFHKEYETLFKLGNIYQGSPEYSYFSLTTERLKKQKLKFVIILDHTKMNFSICLSGQNKRVRKQYWRIFKGSRWNTYRVVESIEDSLFIIDHAILTNPDFKNRRNVTKQIEMESLKFINEISDILEC